MVPLFFHPEVSLDFVVVRQSSVNLLLPIILIFFNDNETAAFNFQNGCYIRRCSSQVPPVNNEEPLMLLYKL